MKLTDAMAKQDEQRKYLKKANKRGYEMLDALAEVLFSNSGVDREAG